MPWNFNAHRRKIPIQNITNTALDLEFDCLSEEKATCLFKDYVDAIFTNQIDSIAETLEPSFYCKAV